MLSFHQNLLFSHPNITWRCSTGKTSWKRKPTTMTAATARTCPSPTSIRNDVSEVCSHTTRTSAKMNWWEALTKTCLIIKLKKHPITNFEWNCKIVGKLLVNIFSFGLFISFSKVVIQYCWNSADHHKVCYADSLMDCQKWSTHSRLTTMICRQKS